MEFLKRHQEQVFALTRIIVGLLFALHGAQKLFGLFGGAPAEMPAPLLYSVGLIELVGGALIAVGFQTRWAAFICSGQMAVAYFMVHQRMGLLPIQNHCELAALYSWVFLLIASTGDGVWSISGTKSS